jgi:hypothetical protein
MGQIEIVIVHHFKESLDEVEKIFRFLGVPGVVFHEDPPVSGCLGIVSLGEVTLRKERLKIQGALIVGVAGSHLGKESLHLQAIPASKEPARGCSGDCPGIDLLCRGGRFLRGGARKKGSGKGKKEKEKGAFPWKRRREEARRKEGEPGQGIHTEGGA